MIYLCSLNGRPFYLNPDLIYLIEELPDTMITLVDGKTLYVANSASEIGERILHYRQSIVHPITNKGGKA